MLGPKHTLADTVRILEQGLSDGTITLRATNEEAQPHKPVDPACLGNRSPDRRYDEGAF